MHDNKGVVFYSQGHDGVIYQRLEIELPPRSDIIRNNDGFLVIKNPVFDLTIMPKYEGFHTSLHPIFTPSQGRFFSPMLISLKIHICVKRKAILTSESMNLYEWLDSLVVQLHDYMSTDRLKERLDVDLLVALSRISTNTTST